MSSPESNFKRKYWNPLLEKTFPGIIILDIDPTTRWSMLDQVLLYDDKWAALETKREENASRRANQAYYVDILNKMSYSNFVSPENHKEVLRDLERLFRPKG